MMLFNSIEQEVLDKIIPSYTDRVDLEKTVSTLSETVNKLLHEQNQQASVELVGSIAKDTYLKNNLDIDLFIIFLQSKQEKKISQITLDIGRTILDNPEECYAEHPYIRGDFSKYKVELVPCYRITKSSEKITAVDRTPLHTHYVKTHLQEDQKQDVRLLKQFLIGINCYGAEAEVQGFSGYLCELLILKYESFHQLLQQVSQWTEGVKISLSAHQIPDFEDPLIFIDPVDKERNVAAAVAPHTFYRFITASNEYIHQPKKTFFFPNPTTPWPLEKIKKTITNQQASYLGIRFNKPNIINENLYPQIRKACHSIKKASAEKGFIIYDIRFHIDTTNNKIYIIIKKDDTSLPETYIHVGPPVHLKKNTKEFIRKWKDHPSAVKPPFQQNAKTLVILKRKYRSLQPYLEEYLTDLSLGKHIDHIISKDYEILSTQKLIIDELQHFWTEYLEDKKPWER